MLTNSLRARGLHVLHCASTGAAAVRLSKWGRTCHNLFNLPPRGSLQYRESNNVDFHLLGMAHVIFIDEYSMLTHIQFEQILLQCSHCIGCQTVEQLLCKVAIVCVGDDLQLLPICQHRRLQVRPPYTFLLTCSAEPLRPSYHPTSTLFQSLSPLPLLPSTFTCVHHSPSHLGSHMCAGTHGGIACSSRRHTATTALPGL